MSMHMVGPWLTTTGKKKGKKKWASAEHKRKFLLAQEQKKELDKEYKLSKSPSKENKSSFVWNPSHPRYTINNRPESLQSNLHDTSKKETLRYSGDKILGIAVLHKSCLQPITKKEEAIEIAHMRR